MHKYKKDNSLENIDNIIEDIQENIDSFNEVSNVLLTPLIEMYEDELENKLLDL